MELAEWVVLFKKTFRFTGGEIVNEFLMSSGWLRGAHVETCPIHARILEKEPPWLGPTGVGNGGRPKKRAKTSKK